MIPIGATVDIANHGGRWRGVVTGRPGPYSIEIDGRLTAPANLAKVVGEMTDQAMIDSVRLNYENEIAAIMAPVVAERDALRELVVAQATTNAELVQELERTDPDEELKTRIDELQEWVANVQSYTEDVLLLFMGERRPVRPIEPPELRRLAEFVFEGV